MEDGERVELLRLCTTLTDDKSLGALRCDAALIVELRRNRASVLQQHLPFLLLFLQSWLLARVTGRGLSSQQCQGSLEPVGSS